MLSQEEAELLNAKLEGTKCIDRSLGDGLFLFVFKGEPIEQASRYEAHIRDCEYCRIAREIYRHKRVIAEVLGQDSQGNKR